MIFRFFSRRRTGPDACIKISTTQLLFRGSELQLRHKIIGPHWATVFARFATLDKHWKRRVENLPKPPKPYSLARIYSKAELDNMVTDIESWVTHQNDGMQ